MQHLPNWQDALFSPEGAGAIICGPYRYRLWRTWNEHAPALVWILLNPSLADANTDDPTLRRLVHFSRAEGAGGLTVVNLFAYRSPDPTILSQVDDPVGPHNDQHILEAVARAERIVVAWGNGGSLHGRDQAVLAQLSGLSLWCLARTRERAPVHPLYQPAARRLQPFLIDR